jgi:hypothetical protein
MRGGDGRAGADLLDSGPQRINNDSQRDVLCMLAGVMRDPTKQFHRLLTTVRGRARTYCGVSLAWCTEILCLVLMHN